MAVKSLPELQALGDTLDSYISKLANVCFAAYGYVHFIHLTNPSYEQHKALDELYSELPGQVDPLIESFLSDTNSTLEYVKVDLSDMTGEDVCDTILMYARVLHFKIANEESDLSHVLSNDLEGLMSFVASVKYKLVRLS